MRQGLRTQPPGELRAHLDLVECLRAVERLRIRVCRPELHALVTASQGQRKTELISCSEIKPLGRTDFGFKRMQAQLLLWWCIQTTTYLLILSLTGSHCSEPVLLSACLAMVWAVYLGSKVT